MCYGGKKKGSMCSFKAHEKKLCGRADMQLGCVGERVFRHRSYKKAAWATFRDTQRHNTPVAGIILLTLGLGRSR